MKKCNSCGFQKIYGTQPICDYMSMTGHRRGCKPGDGCTEWKSEEDVRKQYGYRVTYSLTETEERQTSAGERRAAAVIGQSTSAQEAMRALGLSSAAACALYGREQE